MLKPSEDKGLLRRSLGDRDPVELLKEGVELLNVIQDVYLDESITIA